VGFPGFAFVANEEGRAIAAVDLTAFAVVRHIPVEGGPSVVLTHSEQPSVFALTPDTGSLHEISSARLAFVRKVSFRSQPVIMRPDPAARGLWLGCREPGALVFVAVDSLRATHQIPLGGQPTDLDLSLRDPRAAVACGASGRIVLVDLQTRKLERIIETGESLSRVRFQSDGRQLLAGVPGHRRLSIYSVPEGRLLTHLPLAVRPDNFCFKQDGGQLFVTGAGGDAVVIVYPYRTEVAETLLAGHTPGAMAACTTPDLDYLFVANEEAGGVTVVNVATHQVMGSVQVGKRPSAIAITPDKQYALVLNRASGDMAVIRIAALTRNRSRSLPLFTLIPVGSRPVSVAVQAV
jgi:YVTN family beta-propeller protein